MNPFAVLLWSLLTSFCVELDIVLASPTCKLRVIPKPLTHSACFARLMASIQHENVVRYYEAIIDGVTLPVIADVVTYQWALPKNIVQGTISQS